MRLVRGRDRWVPRLVAALLPALVACGCEDPQGGGYADPRRAFGPPVAADAVVFPVETNRPPTLGRWDTAPREAAATSPGRAAEGIDCAVCHARGVRPDTIAEEQGRDPPLHEGLEPRHGDLVCASCHDPEGPSRLRLADGRTLAPGDALDLCTQCHGAKARDWRNGAHGGMQGYWDLRRGPRTRNHCLDCHDPHEPAQKRVLPVLRPRDRWFGEAHP